MKTYENHPSLETMLANLAVQLKSRRLELGLTQEKLAELSNLNPRHLQKLEAGQLNVTLGTLVSLTVALKTTLTNLLGFRQPTLQGGPVKRFSLEPMLEHCRNTNMLTSVGLTPEILCQAIADTHLILDSLDETLIGTELPRLGGGTIELANLSSIIGNLLGARIAWHSKGRFYRNRPHAFPDLLAIQGTPDEGLEIKVALSTNKPKGHLAKPGKYLTFRYVLTTAKGFDRNQRGDVVTIWEARGGVLTEGDFSLSNTPGDSGKTAVITTSAFRKLSLVYFDKTVCPYVLKENGKLYVDFN